MVKLLVVLCLLGTTCASVANDFLRDPSAKYACEVLLCDVLDGDTNYPYCPTRGYHAPILSHAALSFGETTVYVFRVTKESDPNGYFYPLQRFPAPCLSDLTTTLSMFTRARKEYDCIQTLYVALTMPDQPPDGYEECVRLRGVEI